tara:strand:+ start:7833 stop:8819 length:987 start_codon:yes stop_codon:yes gene_type:complete
MNTSKLISVILPVRNGKEYLNDSIQSILNQTYSNFELIIVNDGSTDNTLEIINSYDDDRIRVFSTNGLGLVNALNLALKHSKGKFIARMDADDVSMQNRLEKQFERINEDEDIGLVFTNVILIDNDSNIIKKMPYHQINNNNIEKSLIFKSKSIQLVHPSILIRKKLLEKIGGYRNYSACEDRDLWLRLISETKFTKLEDPLLFYRVNYEGVSKTMFKKQSVNSILCVLNYTFHKRFNIDIYKDFPDILQKLYKSAENHASKRLFDYEILLDLKKLINNKAYFKIVYKVLRNNYLFRILKYKFFVLKEYRKIVKLLENEALVYINYKK